MVEESPHSPIAPHRGFNHKAREVLIGADDVHLNEQDSLSQTRGTTPHFSELAHRRELMQSMTSKSSSEFDLRRKVVVVLKKSHSPATPGSPKTPNSANSFQGPPIFDSIGERPVVKRHKQLAQIGKTKSCGEIKHVERRAIKTYQEENIIKMPSIDSEFTNLDLNNDCLGLAAVEEMAKARAYEVSEEQKKKNVTSWLNKQS